MADKIWKPDAGQDYVLELSSKTPIENNIVDEAWAEEHRHQLCTECTQVNPSYYPRPFDIVLSRQFRKRTSTTRVDVFGPQVLHCGFAEILRSHNTTAIFGSCYLRSPRGLLLDTEYSTVYDHVKNMVPVTSTKPNELMICSGCGDRVEWPGGNKYLWRDELGDRKWFLECVDLYITRWLNDRIPWDKFPDVEKYRVYIRDR